MPYVLTVKRPNPLPELDTHVVVRRFALATLEKKKEVTIDVWVDAASESGGTLTLPNGTVVDIERQPDDFDVDAFNAAIGR